MFKILHSFILPSFSISIEKWKWNEEYQLYVSNMGHFKDKDKKDVKIYIGKNSGYCYVNYTPVHRIVAKTWLLCENPTGMTVDHIDHNKRNNSVKNLEWVSSEENLKRADEDLIVENFYKSDVEKNARHKRQDNAFKALMSKTTEIQGYDYVLTKSTGEVETFSTYESLVYTVCKRTGIYATEENTIIQNVKKAIKTGAKRYGGYWSKVKREVTV